MRKNLIQKKTQPVHIFLMTVKGELLLKNQFLGAS